MFVGHGLLAFAIVARASEHTGSTRARALTLGFVAALFATLPDLDVVYAPIGLLLRSVQTVGPDVFWETANVIHRGPTHSLVMGAVLALAVALWAANGRKSTGLSLAILAGLVAVATVTSGIIGGLVVVVFTLGGLGVTVLAQRLALSPSEVLPVAAVGLLSHPFGDLFTGSPPPLLYPFDVVVVTERIVLHPDPTGHLLAAFAIELGCIWLAVWTYANMRGYALPELVHPRASLGMGYAVAAILLPAPTLERSAHFVVSVLALGVVGAPIRPFSKGVNWLETLVTGLAAVTVAALAYALAYGLL